MRLIFPVLVAAALVYIGNWISSPLLHLAELTASATPGGGG